MHGSSEDRTIRGISITMLFAGLIVLALLRPSSGASANPLLSGYGGPGQGSQAILGAALLRSAGVAAGGGSGIPRRRGLGQRTDRTAPGSAKSAGASDGSALQPTGRSRQGQRFHAAPAAPAAGAAHGSAPSCPGLLESLGER